MIKRKHWEILYKAILLVLVFLLTSEPLLVAAKPQQVDPRQEAIDEFTTSGDVYLSSVTEMLALSAGLVNSISAIQNTPLSQINESAIAQVRADALKAAEASATALGSIDDLANSIEAFGGNLPAAFDPFQRASQGLPEQLRNDLILEAGLTSADVDAISSGMDDLLLERQSLAANGMPAEVASQLSLAGFSQEEIAQIATVVGTRGLANTSLTTSLAQFRASQDEWADVRTHTLILNIQLMGYQIGALQAKGVQARAVTDAELQEIAEDELRVLVHVAHLQELWGTDPNLNIGEGDWWFIEHYAGRAAERLDALVIDTQNRALIADLFVLQEMKLLALSAKNGDANYVKQELDGLGEILSYLVGDRTFISRQRDDLQGLSYIAARLVSHPNLRAHVQWTVDQEATSGTAKLARVRMDTMGVENLAPLAGVIAEQDETNNIKTLVFMAGLSYFDETTTAILQEIIVISDSIGQIELVDLIQAILTGDTDNPLLIATNMFLGMVPVVNVITDIFALVASDGTFMRAILLFALLCDIGESLALIPGLQVAAGAFIGGAVVAVVKILFVNADVAFKAVLNGFKLRDAFKVIVDMVNVASKHITSNINSLDDAIQALQTILSGELKLWDNFVEFVKRVGTDGLLKLGFDEGSLLVGGIIRRGLELTDETLYVVDSIGDDMFRAGIELSENAGDGVGVLARAVNPEEALSFSDELVALCGTNGNGKSAAKLARPILATPVSDCVNRVQEIIGELDQVAQRGLTKLCRVLGDEATHLALRHIDNPERLTGMLKIMGESSDDFRWPGYIDGLEEIVFSSGDISVDILKYLPINVLDEKLYPGFGEFLLNSSYLNDNYTLMRVLAENGHRSPLLGHITQLQGEYRELRFYQYATADGQDFLFRHTGPINEGGVDAVTKKGDVYYWVDAKDKSQGNGLILDGFQNGDVSLHKGDLKNYITAGSQNTFNREYFEIETLRLVDVGEISGQQFIQLHQALEDGRLEVAIFGGGSLRPFDTKLISISELVDIDTDILVPFQIIVDIQ